MFGMLLAGVFAAFTFSPASALELTGTRRIWDQAPHSAFTGLIDYAARVRRLTPSRLRAPGVRRMASMISPSVTLSHRHIICP